MERRTRGPLNRPRAFWDASALVPLCTLENLTSRVESLQKIYTIAVWWATSVEITSALARLSRMGVIDSSRFASGAKIADALANAWAVILPADHLRVHASFFVTQYALRAGDALQLAAALEWCENEPHGRVFLTADDKLREAARLCGFDTSHL